MIGQSTEEAKAELGKPVGIRPRDNSHLIDYLRALRARMNKQHRTLFRLFVCLGSLGRCCTVDKHFIYIILDTEIVFSALARTFIIEFIIH